MTRDIVTRRLLLLLTLSLLLARPFFASGEVRRRDVSPAHVEENDGDRDHSRGTREGSPALNQAETEKSTGHTETLSDVAKALRERTGEWETMVAPGDLENAITPHGRTLDAKSALLAFKEQTTEINFQNFFKSSSSCAKYRRTPAQCANHAVFVNSSTLENFAFKGSLKVNPCRFQWKDKTWKRMSKKRRKRCAVDLGCKSRGWPWDGACSFQCQEFCEANPQCRWRAFTDTPNKYGCVACAATWYPGYTYTSIGQEASGAFGCLNSKMCCDPNSVCFKEPVLVEVLSLFWCIFVTIIGRCDLCGMILPPDLGLCIDASLVASNFSIPSFTSAEILQIANESAPQAISYFG